MNCNVRNDIFASPGLVTHVYEYKYFHSLLNRSLVLLWLVLLWVHTSLVPDESNQTSLGIPDIRAHMSGFPRLRWDVTKIWSGAKTGPTGLNLAVRPCQK